MTGKRTLKEKKKERRNRAQAVHLRTGSKHVPENFEETEQHTDSWPFLEDEEYSSEEKGRPAQPCSYAIKRRTSIAGQ